MAEIAPVTPMMRQYLEVKAQHPDAILFFRLGDFYEMFMDDAVKASEALQITLTSRSKGDDRVPMCGVPFHAARGYVARLLERGFNVAICDQVEEPGKSSIVKREVTRVVTPGMVFDDQMLDPREASFLGAIALGESRGGLALLDASTGQLRCGEVLGDDRLADELRRAGIRELLISEEEAGSPRGLVLARTVGVPLARCPTDSFARADERLRRHFGVQTLAGFGVADLPLGLSAASAALAYLESTQRTHAGHVDRLARLPTDEVLVIDESTRVNLEIERTLTGSKRKGSLLGLLDHCVTALGSRRLADWLRYPLLDVAAISARHDAVEELTRSAVMRGELSEALRPVADLERLLSRLTIGQGNARDLSALAATLGALPTFAGILDRAQAGLLRAAAEGTRGLEPLAADLLRAVADDPPPTLSEGKMIRRGWSEELDKLVSIVEDGKGYIARLEAEEKEKTGIGSLKVRYNKVFGYYIEVTKANLHLVPEHYQRRQTTVGGERFITPALKDFEEQVLTAEERRFALEQKLFEELRGRVIAESKRLRSAASAIADADALLSLGRVASERGYCRPEVDASEVLEIEAGRHPVVESLLPVDSGGFVPNDLRVASSAPGQPDGAEVAGQLLVITGPNMAGKSTAMRQTALVALLAQVGSFVPAKRARVGLVDRIFTRVGASDDLARGRSTFMVEMTETAAILHNATRKSLVVLDEIGRGTSTFDGLSIAWAVAEQIHDRIGCRTLFATHYHELVDLARERPRVKNLTVAVREVGDRIVFLRKLVPGGASRSYGIEVAKLAGLPSEVLARAREILKNLEALEVDEGGHASLARESKRKAAPVPANQLGLFAPPPPDPVVQQLRRELESLNLDTLRPIDALNLLAQWKAKV
jgi:DNA mismatch repair protein MutS